MIPFSSLSSEEQSLYRELSSMTNDSVYENLGEVEWSASAAPGAAPPTPQELLDRGKKLVEKYRQNACEGLASSSLLRQLLGNSELIDASDKFATLLVIWKPTMLPFLAATLSVLVTRHGIRWLCPKLVERQAPESGEKGEKGA